MTNPKINDYWINPDGTMDRFTTRGWEPAIVDPVAANKYEQERIIAKAKYDGGIREYRDRDGTRINIRSDGTEWIDYKDLPG